MKAKEIFLQEINDKLLSGELTLSESSLSFLDSLKVVTHEVKDITDAGRNILKYMNENFINCNNIFTAKGIGEGIFATGRSVSGSMRKLISSGYVTKSNDGSHVTYSITEVGKSKII